MDLQVWFMIATLLFAIVYADPADQGLFPDEKSSPQKQHTKRQPRYEMKEVILYLTPTQIRALQSGQGLISQQPLVHPQPELSNHQQQKEEVQNILHGKGQQLQHEITNLETEAKQQLQAQEAAQTQQLNNENEQKVAPQEAVPQVEVSQPEKYIEYAPQLQLLERTPPKFRQFVSVQKPQFVPDNYAYLYFYPRSQPQNIQPQYFHHQTQDLRTNEHLLIHNDRRQNNLYDQKFQLVPYDYGFEKSVETHPLHSSPKTISEPLPSVAHQAHHLPETLPEPLPLVAHQLGIDQARAQEMEIHKLQAHEFDLDHFDGQLNKAHLLTAHLEAQHLESQRQAEQLTHLDAQQLEGHLEDEQLKAHQPKDHLEAQLVDDQADRFKNHQLEAHLEAQKLEGQLEAEQFKGHELKANFEGLQLEDHRIPDHFKASQLASHLETQHFESQVHAQQPKTHLEGNLGTEQLKTHQFKPDLQTEELEGQLENKKAKVNQLKALLEAQQSGGQFKFNTEPFEIPQYKSYSEADLLKGKLEAKRLKAVELKAHLEAQQKLESQNIEALRMDAHHEGQQLEAEVAKAEELKAKLESRPEYLKSYNFERHPQPLKLFEPLLQHQGVADILKQKTAFERNPPQLERGFRPLKYAPKFDGEKYAKEIEKILKSIQLEKQEALSKAITITKETPIAIHKEVKVEETPVHIIKHVDVPVPYYIPYPKPYEVKVPQPYPVPIEIINQIPIPIIQMEKVEVEKPVPYEVEKHVPVPVTKNVYVKVEKPYFVEKRVPVEVRKKIPYHKPQKYTIVRHTWKH